jgi:superfamily I DNA/RNA helicase
MIVLFANDADERSVLFSTIHKAKGREWDRVIIIDRENMPLKWARSPWQQKQEIHCQYVAYTRSRHELFFVSSKALNRQGSALGDMQLM